MNAGGFATIYVLGYRLGVQDSLLGIMGTVSQILTCFVYLMSPLSVYLMYVGPIVDLFNGVLGIVNRSLLAKIVSPDELGMTDFLVIFPSNISFPPLADPKSEKRQKSKF